MKRLAYTPVLGNTKYKIERYPAISFDGERIALSPSYHLLQMFGNNRGDEVLKTEVRTYRKPQVTLGCAGVEMFDNNYEFKDVNINDYPVAEGAVMTGGWTVSEGTLIPAANRWNYILLGDPSAYDYTFSADIRRTKGSGPIQLHVRDNGFPGKQNDYIGLTLGSGVAEFYRQAGGVRDTLRAPVLYPFESNRWYNVKIVCKGEQIGCFVNDTLIHEAILPSIPSLVSTAALDKENHTIILKVVNTTQHEEKTELDLQGVSVENTVEIIQLAGDPEARNTYDKPHVIEPETKEVSFSLSGPKIYNFPPNSITIMKWKIN